MIEREDKPIGSQKLDDSQNILRQIELDNCFSLTAEYNKTKIEELMKALLSYAKVRGPVEVYKSSRAVENSPSIRKYKGETIVGYDLPDGPLSLLSWYRDSLNSVDGIARSKAYEKRAHLAEDFLSWILPSVLESLTIPLLFTSLLGAQGRASTAVEHLLNSIPHYLATGLNGLKLPGKSPSFENPESDQQEVIESKPEVLVWEFIFQDDHGGAARLIYNYAPIVIKIIERQKERISTKFPDTVESVISQRGLSGEAAEELRQRLYRQRNRMISTYVTVACNLFINHLPAKIQSALTELREEVIYLTARELDGTAFKDEKGDSLIVRSDLTAFLKQIIKDTNKRTKARIGARTPGGREADYDLGPLSRNYSQVYPDWKDSKVIYRQNRNRNWAGMVKAAHPDLPDDLIGRLADPPELSEYLLSKLDEKGGTSKPSDIALEHAARLCGAPQYHYTIGYLWDLFQSQKKKKPIRK